LKIEKKIAQSSTVMCERMNNGILHNEKPMSFKVILNT
jgi:hypothetical protein